MNEFVVNCDGGSRGNPGQAACGYSIATPSGDEVEGHGERIGVATNNVAEYTAVLRALQRCAELGARRVHVRSDSEWLIRQLTGEYKIKHANLRPLAIRVHEAARAFEQVTYEHVRREQNVRADELVNLALDGLL
ncbi:MAG: ribonuclease HI family protein [Actinomycetota bacterium]